VRQLNTEEYESIKAALRKNRGNIYHHDKNPDACRFETRKGRGTSKVYPSASRARKDKLKTHKEAKQTGSAVCVNSIQP